MLLLVRQAQAEFSLKSSSRRRATFSTRSLTRPRAEPNAKTPADTKFYWPCKRKERTKVEIKINCAAIKWRSPLSTRAVEFKLSRIAGSRCPGGAHFPVLLVFQARQLDDKNNQNARARRGLMKQTNKQTSASGLRKPRLGPACGRFLIILNLRSLEWGKGAREGESSPPVFCTHTLNPPAPSDATQLLSAINDQRPR